MTVIGSVTQLETPLLITSPQDCAKISASLFIPEDGDMFQALVIICGASLRP